MPKKQDSEAIKRRHAAEEAAEEKLRLKAQEILKEYIVHNPDKIAPKFLYRLMEEKGEFIKFCQNNRQNNRRTALPVLSAKQKYGLYADLAAEASTLNAEGQELGWRIRNHRPQLHEVVSDHLPTKIRNEKEAVIDEREKRKKTITRRKAMSELAGNLFVGSTALGCAPLAFGIQQAIAWDLNINEATEKRLQAVNKRTQVVKSIAEEKSRKEELSRLEEELSRLHERSDAQKDRFLSSFPVAAGLILPGLAGIFLKTFYDERTYGMTTEEHQKGHVNGMSREEEAELQNELRRAIRELEKPLMEAAKNMNILPHGKHKSR